jgi:hypothetical protein
MVVLWILVFFLFSSFFVWEQGVFTSGERILKFGENVEYDQHFTRTVRKKNKMALFFMLLVPMSFVFYVIYKTYYRRKYWSRMKEIKRQRLCRRLGRNQCEHFHLLHQKEEYHQNNQCTHCCCKRQNRKITVNETIWDC